RVVGRESSAGETATAAGDRRGREAGRGLYGPERGSDERRRRGRRREADRRPHAHRPPRVPGASTVSEVTPAEARRIAVRAQLLDGSATDVLSTVRHLGRLQI